MQKESGCSSAAPHCGDRIASLYLLIRRHVNVFAVTVISHISVLMQQDNIVTVFRRVTGFMDNAVGCRFDIRALFSRKVNSFVHTHFPTDGMRPLTESI